jgi:broad specificity phosphatase PhoE
MMNKSRSEAKTPSTAGPHGPRLNYISMRIYFATHGTTTDNEEKIASGWKDVGLSELGTKQARELKEVFSKILVDIICCSDLQRSINSAKLAFGDKVQMIIDKRLRELNYGDYNGQPSEIVETMKIKHISVPFPNGESYNQAMERVHEFYKEIRLTHLKEAILVIGHRATQYGLDTIVNGKSLEELLKTKFKWQSYWLYEY